LQENLTVESPLVILQISDLHILASQGKTMAGVDTEHSFISLLEYLHCTYNTIDLLLVTGDLAENPSQSSYQRIYQAHNTYQTRTICLPGNHDDFTLMRQIFADKKINCDKQLQFKHWQIICLNSQKIGSAKGYLATSELDYLTDSLNRHPELNVLIAVHHPPIPTDSQWMDTMMIENSDELFLRLKGRTQVKAITCGHIHQEMEGKEQDKIILGTPSTCFQFKPFSDEYELDNRKPGYRIFLLHSNGQFESAVHRLPA